MKKYLFTMALLLTAYTAMPEMAKAMHGKASKGLIRLATTGNPETLQKELGGKIVSSESIAKMAKSLLKNKEHLAPKALVAKGGDIYAMVAPVITKDNFIYVRKGKVIRMDVGETEGTHNPFIVKSVVADGGSSIWEQLGHWWDNL
jgi:hypothetical protein